MGTPRDYKKVSYPSLSSSNTKKQKIIHSHTCSLPTTLNSLWYKPWLEQTSPRKNANNTSSVSDRHRGSMVTLWGGCYSCWGCGGGGGGSGGGGSTRERGASLLLLFDTHTGPSVTSRLRFFVAGWLFSQSVTESGSLDNGKEENQLGILIRQAGRTNGRLRFAGVTVIIRRDDEFCWGKEVSVCVDERDICEWGFKWHTQDKYIVFCYLSNHTYNPCRERNVSRSYISRKWAI